MAPRPEQRWFWAEDIPHMDAIKMLMNIVQAIVNQPVGDLKSRSMRANARRWLVEICCILEKKLKIMTVGYVICQMSDKSALLLTKLMEIIGQ